MRTVSEHRQYLRQQAAQLPNPAAGFFGPGSMAWQLNREALLGLVVLRALFLQVAHPKVAQGVAEHSDFRRRPFARALATLRAQQTIVFGTADEASEALLRIYARHTAVRGAGYEANDPSLLFWVYATLIDSMFFAYRTFLPDLSPRQWAAFYEEGKLFGRLIGIPSELVPPTKADFDAWMTAALQPGGEIAVSPAGYEIGRSLLRMPIALFQPLTAFIAAGTLPPRLRAEFGLGWSAGRQWVFSALAGGLRRLLPYTPDVLHVAPMYWLALRRANQAQ
ncbi:MAG: DUF2236 domain-containing protein [Anaerolineales bacterium]|nr:MAG: DUF2236 domain-containing protein [Anaerolineales bacterium]